MKHPNICSLSCALLLLAAFLSAAVAHQQADKKHQNGARSRTCGDLIFPSTCKCKLGVAATIRHQIGSEVLGQRGFASDGAECARAGLQCGIFCRPGGLLASEEQTRGADVCIALLKHLTSPDAKLDAWGKEETLAQPSAHAQAVLQLLARLTKQHALAARVSQPWHRVPPSGSPLTVHPTASPELEGS